MKAIKHFHEMLSFIKVKFFQMIVKLRNLFCSCRCPLVKSSWVNYLQSNISCRTSLRDFPTTRECGITVGPFSFTLLLLLCQLDLGSL